MLIAMGVPANAVTSDAQTFSFEFTEADIGKPWMVWVDNEGVMHGGIGVVLEAPTPVGTDACGTVGPVVTTCSGVGGHINFGAVYGVGGVLVGLAAGQFIRTNVGDPGAHFLQCTVFLSPGLLVGIFVRNMSCGNNGFPANGSNIAVTGVNTMTGPGTHYFVGA